MDKVNVNRKSIVLLVGLALLVALPPVALAMEEEFFISLFSRILIYALAAVSLDLILGYAGMASLGHGAFLGVGAYVVGILAFHASEETSLAFLPVAWTGTFEALTAWVLAVLVSALFALVIGALSLRTSGVYFIMITLAFAQMLYFFFISLSTYGGEDGVNLDQRNAFPLLDLGDDTSFYYVCLGLLLGFVYVCQRIVNSRFGMVLRGCKQNETRMQALGYATYRYKLICFVIAGAGAGLAGALAANQSEFVSPGLMHWTRSGEIMIMVILGGMGTLFGPIFGATALLLMEEVLAAYTEHWMIILGPVLILVVLFARRGIYGFLAGPEGAMVKPIDPVLSVHGLVKSFGALRASDGISLDVQAGEIHALIGPNGAGKTTAINQLSGEMVPDEGQIHFNGQNVTGLSVDKRARLGLARSYQITSIFPAFTALENLAMAVQSTEPHHFRFWKNASRDPARREPAMSGLERLGMAELADVTAGALAHGQQRQLELAMALATRPKMLLLDEPMAGMGPEESRRMTDTLLPLKGQLSILLVEHDMDVVFALADRITVLVLGKPIATDTPENIRANPAVRAAYLGEPA